MATNATPASRAVAGPITLALAAALALTSTPSVAENTPDWRFSGDLRTGYTASWRDARDGSTGSADNWRARLRLRAERSLGAHWRFTTRLAGSYASDQDSFDFYLRRARPGGTGVNPGDTTLDELYLGYIAPESRWRARIGRFQTGWTLPVVPGKSLDRNDSSSFGVGWTDGVHLELPTGDGWRSHLIAQNNSRNGTGNTIRGPLDFSRGRSDASLHAAIEATEHPGPLTLRMLTLTWMPDALASRGVGDSQREDYWVITAKAAAEWPLADSGRKLVLAGEVGHAPGTPRRESAGLSGAGEVSGNGWQASANLFDLAPGHHLGIVYGRTQAGWLISNDYRANDELAEIRYQWRPIQQISTEIRYRWRRELEIPRAADRRRRDRDVYARLTLRF